MKAANKRSRLVAYWKNIDFRFIVYLLVHHEQDSLATAALYYLNAGLEQATNKKEWLPLIAKAMIYQEWLKKREIFKAKWVTSFLLVDSAQWGKKNEEKEIFSRREGSTKSYEW